VHQRNDQTRTTSRHKYSFKTTTRRHSKTKKLVLSLLKDTLCIIPTIALAEIAFVLERYYELERHDINLAIRTLSRIENIKFEKELLDLALFHYLEFPKAGLEDEILAAEANIASTRLLTFDKILASKIQNLELLN